MCTTFQRGYRIIVNDTPLPGIYEPKLAQECSMEAIRAAEEITRQAEEPTYTMIPVFCTEYTQADKSHLRGILLESFEGVEKLEKTSSETVVLKNEYASAVRKGNRVIMRHIYHRIG